MTANAPRLSECGRNSTATARFPFVVNRLNECRFQAMRGGHVRGWSGFPNSIVAGRSSHSHEPAVETHHSFAMGRLTEMQGIGKIHAVLR